MKQLVSCPVSSKSWFRGIACVAIILACNTVKAACPCPPVNTERAFVACDVLAGSVDADQVRVQDAACFQGPVQLCSGASGLPRPVLEGLWTIALQGQPVGPGESALQMIGRTRAVTCSGTIVAIDFNQQTVDPADAFTLLKTIQAGDTLQFTRINPINCEAEQAVSACAAGEVTGCGPVFTIPVFDASGLSGLYGAVGQYVSLLNFGPKPSTKTQLDQLQDCTNCSPSTCSDRLCWPSQVCSGLTADFIPPECTGLTGASERILVNADHLGAVAAVAVPKTTLGGCSVTDILCATRVGDRLRLYAPTIASETLLDTPPGQLGWATALLEPFGPVSFINGADQANAVAIDNAGTIILAGLNRPTVSNSHFAALQLIPDSGDVQLGWATALVDPFGNASGLGDEANGVAIDAAGNIILAGVHDPAGATRFAALQLMPDMLGGVDLGWATAIFEPFGPQASIGEQANAVCIAGDNSIILVGVHRTPMGVNQFAALQLLPSGSSVQLGWATALSAPFGPVDAGALNGDTARAVAMDGEDSIILAGSHNPLGTGVNQFAALQLIFSGASVQLGWTAAFLEPFGVVGTVGDVAYGVAVDCNNDAVLAGFHELPNGADQMAALKLVPDGGSVKLGWSIALSAPFGPVGSNGDEARGLAIDKNNAVILGGFHAFPGAGTIRFAAAQLIPNAAGSATLGWTAVLPTAFGVAVPALSHGVVIDQYNDVILGGLYNPAFFGVPAQFAALQLRQPLVPAYGDYEIASISEVDDYIVFGLTLIDTESSTVCGELCIKNLGPCCI